MIHPRPISLLSAAVVACAASIAVGCGGDTRRGEDTQAPTSQQTAATTTPATSGAQGVSALAGDPARRAYVARVDSLCRRLDPERNAARERAGSAANPAEAATAYDEGTSAGWRELREIEAIPAPHGDRNSLQANLFGPIATQLALRRQIRDALVAVDVPRLRVLRGQLDDLTRSEIGFARGYGFRACGAE